MTRSRFLVATVVAVVAASGIGLAVTAGGVFDSSEKSAAELSGPKGTPIPGQTSSGGQTGDGWTVVEPEDRDDISLIDISEADLFLPGSSDAAACEVGTLDQAKTERALREWLSANKAEFTRERVWNETLIGVVCSYPNEDYPGKVVLYIGIPDIGQSYLAPEACQNQAVDLPPQATLPGECVPPDDAIPPFEVASYTVIFEPEEVLQ